MFYLLYIINYLIIIVNVINVIVIIVVIIIIIIIVSWLKFEGKVNFTVLGKKISPLSFCVAEYFPPEGFEKFELDYLNNLFEE